MLKTNQHKCYIFQDFNKNINGQKVDSTNSLNFKNCIEVADNTVWIRLLDGAATRSVRERWGLRRGNNTLGTFLGIKYSIY